MMTIPLESTPAQVLTVTLAGQLCQITLRQKSTGVYLDLSVLNKPLLYSALCLDRIMIVRSAYLGFIGSLVMVDTRGTTNPDYTGFGARYQLIYLETTDL
jgi:hypothetical protein